MTSVAASDCPVSASRGSSAFTLIELLVIIAIVAVLLGLLAPSLSRTQELARSVVCCSNLHQLGVAGHEYQAVFGCFPPDSMNGNTMIWPLQLNLYCNSTNVFNCPSVPDWVQWNEKTLTKSYDNIPFSYGIDCWGSADGSYLGWWTRVPAGRKTHEIVNMGNFYWFSDSDSGLPADPVGRWDLVMELHAFDWCVSKWSSACQGYNENPGKRHVDRTNMVFADGHVESLLWDDMFKAETLPKGDPVRIQWRRKDNFDNEPHEEYGN